MCLIIKKDFPEEGREALRTYRTLKVLDVVNAGQDGKEERLQTHFVGAPVSVGCTMSEKPGTPVRTKQNDGRVTIDRGAVHACTVDHDGIARLRSIIASSFYRNTMCVAECTIPVGATYWVGTLGDICADTVKVERIVYRYRHEYDPDQHQLDEWIDEMIAKAYKENNLYY